MRTREEAEALFNANRGIIYLTMQRTGYRNPRINRDYDDAEQVALTAAWRACQDHDPAIGKISTLVRKYVMSALLNHRARYTRNDNLCGMVHAPKSRKHERADVLGYLPDDRTAEDIEAIEAREESDHRMAILRRVVRDHPIGSAKHQEVVRLLLDGLTSEEIERIANVSHASVKNYKYAFLSHVRRVLALESREESAEAEAIIAACEAIVAEGGYPSKRAVAARLGWASATVMRRSQKLRESGIDLPMMNMGEYSQLRKRQARERQLA